MPFNQFGQFGPNYYGQQSMNPFSRGLNNPINTPINRMPIKPPVRAAAPKFTFSKFLNGTQQVIETVSSAIPLYTQVKPLFSGMHGVTKSIKNSLFSKKSTKKEYIDNPEIITPKKSMKKDDIHEDLHEETGPNRPFF
ncbi:MAG: hypothetical protein J1F32_06860 [Erysipelotrichales bacterium]|nr:hypothetical protein [Erysipelotrichales bacterium]